MINLVPFAPNHFGLLSTWLGDQIEVVQWGGPTLSFPLSSEQLQQMVDECLQDPPARLCWMAKKDENFIGHAQLGLDWRNGVALLSRVIIAPSARGSGLAKPMLALVIERAFALEQIERLELNVYTWNVPAIHTYERLGFSMEGVRRSSTLVDGIRWDTAIMSLLRREWPQPA